MQRSTFKVLFYVKRQSEKSGQVPVMGRITINGTISQFSCKLTVRSSLWDAKANKVAGKSFEAQRLNEKLENIKTNIGKQYQRLCDRDSYVTAEKVRNAFLGMGDACRLLLQTFDEYLAGFLKRVGKDRTYSNPKDTCFSVVHIICPALWRREATAGRLQPTRRAACRAANPSHNAGVRRHGCRRT